MDLRRFDLNLLVLFEALWEERSVSAAARRLQLGQPAASAALSRLRKLIGDDLFIRAGSRMEPTPRATALVEAVRAALGQIRQALDQSTQFEPGGSRATFVIGHNDYTALATLPGFVSHVRRVAPGVSLRLLSYEKGDVGAMLDKREIDVAVGVFPQPPPSCVCVALFEETFIGVAARGHPALQANVPIDAAAFAAIPQALMTLKRDNEGYIDDRLAELGLDRRVCLTAPYMFAVAAALTDSDLVAAFPRRAARTLEALGLQTFELPFGTAPWTVSMLWNPLTRSDPSLIWLRGALVETCRLDHFPLHRPS
jgi:DNA-binding transcriptional LysR family regulator